MPPPNPPKFKFMFVGPPRYLRWLFEGEFWKDVCSRTVAGAIVVLLGYLYGVGAGTIPPPTNKNFVVIVAVVLFSFVVSSLLWIPLAAVSDLMGTGGPRQPFVMPTRADVFTSHMWQSKRWWAKAPYHLFRAFVILFPLLGTVGLSALLLWAFAP